MPLEIQKEWYTRSNIQANPHKTYIFGDNFVEQGYGGQAAACRDEPNVVGIATKRYPTNEPEAFLNDNDFQEWFELAYPKMVQLTDLIREGKIVVWPGDGIGTGLAKLENTSPKIFQYTKLFFNILQDLSKEYIEKQIEKKHVEKNNET